MPWLVVAVAFASVTAAVLATRADDARVVIGRLPGRPALDRASFATAGRAAVSTAVRVPSRSGTAAASPRHDGVAPIFDVLAGVLGVLLLVLSYAAARRRARRRGDPSALRDGGRLRRSEIAAGEVTRRDI